MCAIIKVYEITRNFNKCPVMFSFTFPISSSFFSSLLFCYLNMNIINIRMDWRRKWQPSPVFLPGKFHGQRSLVGYSLWGHKRVRHDWATSNSKVCKKAERWVCSIWCVLAGFNPSSIWLRSEDGPEDLVCVRAQSLIPVWLFETQGLEPTRLLCP